MYERRSFLRDPKKQVYLAIGLALLLFILLLGRQGVARDVTLGNGFAYVAVGQHGGVRVLNVIDPTRPVEVGYYDTPGSANRLALVGSRLYVADGRVGMRVMDVSNPAMPVVIGALRARGDIQDVAVAGSYAYLAAGDAGLIVVDVTNPTRPFMVAHLAIPGYAHAVAISEVYDPLFDLFPDQPGEKVSHVLVAAGGSGLHVVDVRQPFAPVLAATFDPAGDVVDVQASGPFAVAAAGRAGLRLLEISDPLLPAEVIDIDTPGEARAVHIAGSTVYVGDGERGVRAYDFSSPLEPFELIAFDTPGFAQGITGSGGYIYVSDGNQGVRIVDLARPGQVAIYETPGEASFTQLLRGMGAILTARWGDVPAKVWVTLRIVFFSVVLFLIVLAFWMFFFGQFVLPVRTLGERWLAADRLFAYLSGSHGPALFIHNGDVKESAHERTKRGRGVALVDTASGAVLRNSHAFTRAIGPGIVFTGSNEYLAGAVDLHHQVKSLGPPDGEDPFAPQREDEAPEAYEQRRERRYQTSGLTRDGVEVIPIVTVVFKLISEPGQGNTQFGYNPTSVWKAIAHEGVDADALPDSKRYNLAWNWLPVYVAVDLWREYLRKFALDQLFAYTSPARQNRDEPHLTAFDTIVKNMRARMVEAQAPELDEYGTPTGGLKDSNECKLLRDRGIEVLGVNVRSLRFPRPVEDQLVEQWKATWLQRAIEERKDVERLHAQERVAGQDVALKHFSTTASQNLVNTLPQDDSLELTETLKLLFQGTLKVILRESDLHPRLTNQKNDLVELIEWIRKQ